MKEKQPIVTVFTPTYNRAYIIEKLYSSLKRQTNMNFEWLVVDDGSTDNTEEVFAKWIAKNDLFNIRYYKKSNGGKHTAINKGLELAKGKLFFTVDSDDYLTDDAIEKIITWEAELPKDKKYCGFAGNLGTEQKVTPNNLFESEHIDGTAFDRYNQADGERALVFYTDIHRNYTYPVFENEKFMTEAVAWNRMANDGYLIRFYNDIIWIYEYMSDGLTKAGKSIFLHNPMGYGLWLREKAEFTGYPFIKRIKLIYNFICEEKDFCNTKVIAKSIGVQEWVVKLFQKVNKVKKH